MTETITGNQISSPGTAFSRMVAFVQDIRVQEEYSELWSIHTAAALELARRSNHVFQNTRAYKARIGTLKSYAEADGIELRDTSKQDFWKFIQSVPLARKANVVITDDGNLRIVWRTERNEHLGIEFLGGSRVEYVMWRDGLEPKAGRDTLDGVKKQIRVSGLNSVLRVTSAGNTLRVVGLEAEHIRWHSHGGPIE